MRLVAHALWSTSHERVLVWAESAARWPGKVFDNTDARGARAHPFAAPFPVLRQILGASDEVTLTAAVLLLPSDLARPLPSPWLGCDAPSSVRRVAPWAVPALSISPAALAEALSDEVACADSVSFVVQVAAFGAQLVRAGAVVPSVSGRAVGWEPLLGLAAASQRLQVLAEAMPPSVAVVLSPERLREHAASGLPWSQAPRPSAEDVVSGMVRASASALAQQRLSRDPVAVAAPPGAAARLLAALGSGAAEVRRGAGRLSAISQALVDWRGGLASPMTLTWRSGLRLLAPEAEDADWRLELMLCAAEDPSLKLTAAQLWDEALLLPDRATLQERLRLLRARASRLLPVSADADPSATIAIDSRALWDALQSALPKLEAAGVLVEVPPWWSQATAPLRARAVVSADEGGDEELLGLRELCAFRWEIALGEQPLSEEELSQLAALKVPLLKRGGRWVRLSSSDLEQARRFHAEPRQARASVVELLQLQAGVREAPGGLSVASVSAPGALGALFGGADQQLSPVAPPATLHGTLRGYQVRGLSWLAFLDGLGLGGCLADDMGLGKTVQLLALLLSEREGARPVGPTLLVCPTSVLGNWRAEAARFAPSLRVRMHHGPKRLSGAAFAADVEGADLILTSYALTWRDAETLGAARWHRVVLDEAQNIKNSATRQARAIRALPVLRRVALTGTPVENRLDELWSLMQFLNPGLLGAADAFRADFSRPIEQGDAVAAARLRALIQPFVLRRLKTDRAIITDLPDKIETVERCGLTREQASLYRATLHELMSQIEVAVGMQRRGLIFKATTQLKQLCNHPALMLKDSSPLGRRSGKLNRLCELLDEIHDAGERTLIFTQYATWGRMLQAELAERTDREVLFLHGGTPQPAREELVARFQSAEGPGTFILSLKAGGTGLNLTAATHVIHYDRWWNPAVEQQATDRAYRIGQRRVVQVHKLVCGGTLEERIGEIIEQKRALSDQVISAGEGWLTELSTEQLRDLLSLSSTEPT